MTFDLLSAAMYSDGEFALAQYLPYTLVPFFPLFNERGGPKVERNSADWDVRHFLSTPVILPSQFVLARISKSLGLTKKYIDLLPGVCRLLARGKEGTIDIWSLLPSSNWSWPHISTE